MAGLPPDRLGASGTTHLSDPGLITRIDVATTSPAAGCRLRVTCDLRAAHAPPEPLPDRGDSFPHSRPLVASWGLCVRFRGILAAAA